MLIFPLQNKRRAINRNNGLHGGRPKSENNRKKTDCNRKKTTVTEKKQNAEMN